MTLVGGPGHGTVTPARDYSVPIWSKASLGPLGCDTTVPLENMTTYEYGVVRFMVQDPTNGSRITLAIGLRRDLSRLLNRGLWFGGVEAFLSELRLLDVADLPKSYWTDLVDALYPQAVWEQADRERVALKNRLAEQERKEVNKFLDTIEQMYGITDHQKQCLSESIKAGIQQTLKKERL